MIEIVGRVKDISRSMEGRTRLLIESETDLISEADTLLGYERISAKIGKYKPKRSLDANAYYWQLLTKLARLLRVSNNELHNRMLCEYGQPWIVGGSLHRAMLPDTDEVAEKVARSAEYHLRPTTQVVTLADKKDYRTYITMRGSSSYDTAEMARLIDGLISDCRASGMPDGEIMTPDEKTKLKEVYGIGK